MKEMTKQKLMNLYEDLQERNLKVEKFGTDGIHWRIENTIDYWPTTGKWIDRLSNLRGVGHYDLLKYLSLVEDKQLRKLSAEDFFEIAKHCKDRSLEGICNAIHAEVYKSKTL